ncbi:MAG: PatB family C-S lyase [Paraperlucidibaca sp.]
MLSPGVVPALYAAVHALTQPGDGIIVMPPVYPPLFSAVTDNQRELILNPLLIKERRNGQVKELRYEIDWDGLERCAAHAKMLLFCSPHNPVGRVWSREELAQLLDVAERHDLIIISDEIHADLTFVPHTVLATLPGAAKRVITTMAPSKTFNIPGLGLAWLAVSDSTQREAIKAQYAKLAIQVNNPLSLVATEAAYGHGKEWLSALLDYVKITHDEVLTRLAQHPRAPQAIAAEGTYLLWLDCRHMGLNDGELQTHFVEKASVGLSAGPFFGAAGSGFMRLNLASPRHIVLDAIDRLIASVED